METVKLSANSLDDLALALRATQWLRAQPKTQKDAILAYGEGSEKKHFYVRRGKSCIIARPC